MEFGPDFFTFMAVGFLAQLVDGALGMAFGVISTSALVALGVPPAAASAGVHTVETVTTAVSGTSHAIARNVDWKLFARIAIPGVIGAVAGIRAVTGHGREAAEIPALDQRAREHPGLASRGRLGFRSPRRDG